MKYFIDTEFLEGTQKGIFKDSKPTIDLISIGIVAEDGREYYAISKDFNIKEAWNRYQLDKWMHNPVGPQEYVKNYWLRDNVLKPIFIELRAKEVEEYNMAKRRNVALDFPEYSFCFREFKRLINKYGATNKQIAEEVKEFVTGDSLSIEKTKYYNVQYDNIEFYGYYCDYDWVVFCWLFGKMIDLPKGFPMFCMDLKQMLEGILDTKASHTFGNDRVIPIPVIKENIRTWLKTHPQYPAQVNEHNALEDAKWNKKYYEFLKSL